MNLMHYVITFLFLLTDTPQSFNNDHYFHLYHSIKIESSTKIKRDEGVFLQSAFEKRQYKSIYKQFIVAIE